MMLARLILFAIILKSTLCINNMAKNEKYAHKLIKISKYDFNRKVDANDNTNTEENKNIIFKENDQDRFYSFLL